MASVFFFDLRRLIGFGVRFPIAIVVKSPQPASMKQFEPCHSTATEYLCIVNGEMTIMYIYIDLHSDIVFSGIVSQSGLGPGGFDPQAALGF